MNESAGAAPVTTKPQFENYYRWVEPDSDITVCLKLDTADHLQLEVLRGIDSSSDSGNEVGGILFGRTEFDEGRTLTFVDDFEPIPCEHRYGPSYALTAKDAVNFEAALARGGARRMPSVVGYYRSHNRHGLFLSGDDLQLIQRHFRRPDNLFLLIKTLPNRACTAGFFFWKDGHIQSEFTDSEAPLIPISIASAGRNLSLGEAVDDIPAARSAMALPERARSRDLQRRLIHGLVVTGVAAAVTLAVVRHRETGPAQNQTPGAHQPGSVAGPVAVPVAAAQSAASRGEGTPTAVRTPPPVVEPSAPIGARPPKTRLQQARNESATPPGGEPKLQTATPAPETAAVKPLTGSAERPLNTAPASPAETTIAPPIPPTPAPLPENPITPASPPEAVAPRATTLAPRTDTAPAAAPASQAAPTFVGPQVIHQVTPAVPRGVGPMITTDVQVDVAVAIDANGKVTSARVASTKGAAAGLLTIEALKAAQLFRFQPARENGRNAAGSMVLTFRFARTAK